MKRKNIFKFIIVISMFFFGSIFLRILLNLFGIDVQLFDSKDLNYLECLIELIYALIIYFLYRKYFREDYKEVRSGFKKYVSLIIKYFFIFFIVKIASSSISAIIGLIMGVELGESENQNLIVSLTSAAPFIMLISAVILAPIVEEGVFRLALRKIVNNKYIFVIISGLIFGFMHIFPTDLSIAIALVYSITYVAMGVYLANIYVETDNIWICIIIHSLNNLISMLAIMLMG